MLIKSQLFCMNPKPSHGQCSCNQDQVPLIYTEEAEHPNCKIKNSHNKMIYMHFEERGAADPSSVLNIQPIF